MFKHSLYGMVLFVTAVSLCLSTPTLAHQKARPEQRGARTHRPEPKAARTRHQPHRHRLPHVPHHEHRPRIHPHGGLSIGIAIGNHRAPRAYPHGHPRHFHDAHCPVVIKKHVQRYVVPPPVWHVYHHRRAHAALEANLQIVIYGHHGALYVNNRYLGQTERFHDGRVHVSVLPGTHVIQLRQGGTAYTQHVKVKRGTLAVVEARPRR